MSTPDLRVLFDVDNTLLDNDAFAADLDRCLQLHLGDGGRARYWQVYEALRAQYGYVDYLGTLQRLRDEGFDTAALSDVAGRLLDYPFEERRYPDALAAVAHVAALAPVAILSDGDIVFQPRKIRRSGLEQAFTGQVLVCVHKERQVGELKERFPARHYALVDDKPALLARMKARLGSELTTIWVRQGHYARDTDLTQLHPAPDHAIDGIAQLRELQRSDFQAGASTPATT
jgi:FMN phosphatase YigB (HAD superfamily)